MLKAVALGLLLLHVGVCGDENVFSLIADIFNISRFENISTNCRRDLQEYVTGVQTGENWALTMLDSMEKFPTGILLGRAMAPGQYEECLSAVHPNFTGQHCTVDITLKILKNTIMQHSPLAGSKDRSTGSIARTLKGEFGYGVCIPSTCNPSDLQAVFAESGLNEILTTKVDENDCQVNASFQEFRVKDYLVLAVLLLVVLLAVGSTIYDLWHAEKTETQNMVFKSFSLHSNLKSLFHINNKYSHMNSLNGLRFLSMAWIILGHYAYNDYSLGDGVNNIFKFEMRDKISAIPLTNAFPSVDTFFFLSGLLACFVFFRDVSVKGYYDFPVAVLQRYIRLTVPVAAVVLIHFTIYSRLISAPFSKLLLNRMEMACQTNWWTFLLYIQNFYYDSRRCLPQSWYLGTDMQLYLLSPLIMYVLHLWPKFAPTYIGLLIVGSSLLNFIILYECDLPPNYTLEYLKGIKTSEYFYFYTRMSPWVVGIATGYILCGMQAKKITFRPTKVWVALGWLTSIFLCLASLYGIAAFLPASSEHSDLDRSSYRAFHRLGWGLGLSWITIACVGGYGGFINTFLSLTIFQPLAKLTYCMYLIHLSVQRYRLYKYTRHSDHIDLHALMYSFLADVVVTIAVSIIMTLLLEMPFVNLSKILLKNVQIFPYPRKENSNKLKQFDLEKCVQSEMKESTVIRQA